MSREQAMAFLEALVGSPKTKVHLEAILGWQKSPAMEDFLSREGCAIERCDDLISYLEEVSGVLRELQEVRERQLEVALEEMETHYHAKAITLGDAIPNQDPGPVSEEEEKIDPSLIDGEKVELKKPRRRRVASL